MKTPILLSLLFFLAEGRALAQSSNGLPQQVDQLAAQVATLQQQVAALQSASQPLTLTVNCGAGQTVGAALAQAQSHSGPVNIIISGTCTEQVTVNRDDVTLQGNTPTDGLKFLSSPSSGPVLALDGQRIKVANLTVSGGTFGIYATHGASVNVFSVDVSGAANVGINAANSATANVNNSKIHGNQTFGVSAVYGGSLIVIGSSVTGNGFHGAYASIFGVLSLRQDTIEGNGGTGVLAWLGGVAEIQGCTIQGNVKSGASAISNGTVWLDGGTVVSGNQGGAYAWGSTLQLGAVTIQANNGDGVVLIAGSSLQLNGANSPSVIINNSGNGITAQDTSALGTNDQTGIRISGNGGWGVFCSPPPAVAQITAGPAAGSFSLTGTSVFNNHQGQISCPGELIH